MERKTVFERKRKYFCASKGTKFSKRKVWIEVQEVERQFLYIFHAWHRNLHTCAWVPLNKRTSQWTQIRLVFSRKQAVCICKLLTAQATCTSWLLIQWAPTDCAGCVSADCGWCVCQLSAQAACASWHCRLRVSWVRRLRVPADCASKWHFLFRFVWITIRRPILFFIFLFYSFFPSESLLSSSFLAIDVFSLLSHKST